MLGWTYRAMTLSLAVFAGLVLVACGGDDDSASTPPECPSSYRVTFLPTPLFTSSSSAISLNNQNPTQAVGEIGGDAARWSDGTVSAIVNTFGGFNSIALGINDSNIIVGGAETTTANVFHAFRYSNGTMTDLGTLGGQNSSAAAINDSGQVVGSSQTAGASDDHAFLYSQGTMRELAPSTISSASGINNKGHVVGHVEAPSSPTGLHAFRYCAGSLTDLNSLVSGAGVELLDALDINDRGEIVGVGSQNASPIQQAILLTPQ